MKRFALLAVLCATACGLVNPVAKSPCQGLWCIGVETAGVPGAELLCYQSEPAGVKRLTGAGCTVGGAADKPVAVCPRGVTLEQLR